MDRKIFTSILPSFLLRIKIFCLFLASLYWLRTVVQCSLKVLKIDIFTFIPSLKGQILYLLPVHMLAVDTEGTYKEMHKYTHFNVMEKHIQSIR